MLAGPLPALVDHRKLASQEARLEGELPITHFPRFAEMLASNEGEVTLSLSFGHDEQHRVKVSGKLSVTANLICQSCLESFSMGLSGELDYLILASEEELDELEDKPDSIIHGEGKITVRELLEDDLILSVPMIPRHAGQCPGSEHVIRNEEPAAQEQAQEQEQDSTTHQPFAGLAEAMKKQNEVES